MKVNKRFSSADIFSVKKDLCFSSVIDDVTYVLDQSNQEVYKLSEVGGVLWKFLEKKVSIENLVSKVCLKYNVDKDVARKDVEDFLKRFIKRKLISAN